jgi:integrase
MRLAHKLLLADATPLGPPIRAALKHHWLGTRKHDHAAGWLSDLAIAYPKKGLDTLASDDIEAWLDKARKRGLSPATLHQRVSTVNVLYDVSKTRGYKGPVPLLPHVRRPKVLKWWLNPDTEREVLQWLRINADPIYSSYVIFGRLTGLRVEEMLALRRCHFHGLSSPTPQLTVPGTKTSSSQATLPLSLEAARYASGLLRANWSIGTPSSQTPVFSFSYGQLWETWDACRKALGLSASTATLKALRRSYARDRAGKGIPLTMLAQLMRHKSVKTTMGYLELVGGGFNDAELRPFL